MNILIALGIPFIGTTLGAAMVFYEYTYKNGGKIFYERKNRSEA